MKKAILILYFASCILYPVSAQQYGWKDISRNIPDFPFDTVIINGGDDTLISNLTDICFINDNEGWITSSHTYSDQEAAILHTTDGGETWDVQTVMRSCQFIHMVSSEIGYATSDGGKIFKTTDGGQNWIIHGITGTNITGMSFPEGSDTGYICSYSASKMHQVTPEGLNVINFDNSPFWWQSISAPSHEIIWLATGTSVYAYDEGGLTDQPVTSDNYYSIFFIQDDLGWGCGSHGVKERNQGTIMGCVGKDIPWVVLSYTENPLYDVFALDKDHIWATGALSQVYFTDNASDFGFNQQTSTGWTNVSFIKQPTPLPEAIFRSVFFTSVNKGYLAGNSNVLLKYGQVSGMDDHTRVDVEVYPNPVGSLFAIRFSQLAVGNRQSAVGNRQSAVTKIEVVDLFGKVVLELFDGKISSETMEFDVSALSPGIYLIKLTCYNDIIIKKLVKH